jgi:hypothetical protein
MKINTSSAFSLFSSIEFDVFLFFLIQDFKHPTASHQCTRAAAPAQVGNRLAGDSEKSCAFVDALFVFSSRRCVERGMAMWGSRALVLFFKMDGEN